VRHAPRRASAGALIALAAFLTFALTGGGRIVGSDEVTMFELARAMAHGRIDVPEGATLRGPDGRSYSKNTAGEAVLALPLVVAGDVAARAAGFRDERAQWAARFVASFFNAIVAALLLGATYAALRGFRVSARASFGATLLLGFTTPLWIYAKSFMAEPVEALGMLLALAGAARAGAAPAPSEQRRGELVAALGAFLALSAKLGVAPMVLACLGAAGFRHVTGPGSSGGLRPRAWLVPLAGVAAALLGHAIYNAARFGSVLETGYGAQASAAAFTTPLLVGVYGLLISSGKGVMWFAPMVWLLPWGAAAMVRSRQHSEAARRGDDARRAGWAIVAAWAVGLFVYGRFQHWAGDGSWGPRYLVPLLPLAAIAAGFALDGASRVRRRVASALGAVGLVVTLGGVGIYFGAQMREAGDYPYTLALEDPHFMEASHWDPRFTPIAGHWRMLARNLGEHLRGDVPVLGQKGDVDPRTGITPGEERTLLHAIDAWWLYAGYAGLPKLPLGLAALALLAASIWAWMRAWRAAREEPA
jgi:hypothetical protein